MSGQLDYSLAFVAGLLGSGHCIGMCGSLVSAFFMRMGPRAAGILPQLSYHGARIGVYTLVGAIAAGLGVVLVSSGLMGKGQALLQIVAGLVVILLGLDILGWLPFRLPIATLPAAACRGVFTRARDRGTLAAAASGGVLNGLMPCSLTLAMAVKATTAPDPLQGAGLMLAFGLGTIPAMLFVGTVFQKLGAVWRTRLMKGAALFVIALGGLTVYQGARFFRVMITLPNW